MADKTIRSGLRPGGRERKERFLRLLQQNRVDLTHLTTHYAFGVIRTKADGT